MTRLTCLYCGRETKPFLTIGSQAIGPKCAKRMGLTRQATRKNPRIKWHARQEAQKDEAQAELFDE